MNPLVSVIIPNYNHAQFLEQRIESVLSQSYQHFELIILDDCSTDESIDIIMRYKDNPKVSQIIINERNSGSPFLQWKKGLEHSNGTWIWIAESDDYADSEFLVRMLSADSEKNHPGLIYCDSKIVNGNNVAGRTFADMKNETLKTTRWSTTHVNFGLDELQDFLLPFGTINNTSAVLFRKDILEKVNPFDFQFKYIGDKYAFAKVLAASDIAYVKDSLNYYRDPFNSKHAKLLIHYYYEQFLIFHWVLENVKVDRKKFFDAFYRNTDNSLFKGWDKMKVRLYYKLFKVDQRLFFLSIAHNALRPFKKKLTGPYNFFSMINYQRG